MAVKKSIDLKKDSATKKQGVKELRKEVEDLTQKLERITSGAYCHLCGKFKDKDKFYISSNPLSKSGVSPICKECAKKIAERIDKNGDYHEPTRESIIMALRYLDKPFFNGLYNSSIQEASDPTKGNSKANAWRSYIKNVSMNNYIGMTFEDSDLFKQTIIYNDEKDENYLRNKDIGTYDQYVRDKADTVRLLGYDPFEKESVDDQPLLYSQLLGMLDSSEDRQDDMMRISSIISICRSFLQIQKLDDSISRLMMDYVNIERNAAAIKSMQESKNKINSSITSLAAESCISLKNSKHAKKGENSWTGKLKKLKDVNLREYELNGYDIETCKGMQQVADISIGAIIKQLKLDDSDYADMVAEQTEKITEMKRQVEGYREAVRIMLRENLDLRDLIKANGYDMENELVDLNEFVNNYIVHNEGVVNGSKE